MQLNPATSQATTSRSGLAGTDPVIAVSTDPSDFDRLRPEWERLNEQSPDQDPFLSCDWFTAWWRAFGGQRRLHLVTARQQGRLCAVLPMMLERTWRQGIPLRRLAALANDHSPHFDLVRSHDGRFVHRAVWNHLMTLDTQWDLLDFPGLCADSNTADRFGQLAYQHGVPHEFWQRAPRSPWVIIQPSWDDYLDARSASFRKSLRRKMRGLAAHGRVRLETVTDCEALDQGLADGMRIESEGWKGSNRTAMLSQPAIAGFYTDLARVMAHRGQLRLHFLTLDGVRIAFDYSIESNQCLYSLKAGHRSCHAGFSPGTLLLGLIVEQAHQQGLVGIDLLGDADPFKRHWTDTYRAHRWLQCYSGSIRGRLFHTMKSTVLPILRSGKRGGDSSDDRKFHP